MNKLPVEVTGITGWAPYQFVVILHERNGRRWLPIFIGAHEAHNIQLLLDGLKNARPLTYDFFGNLLENSGVQVEEITVTDLRENTFFAEVKLRLASGEVKAVDARPSDAIALGIKCRTPIKVNSKVMDEAGMQGEISFQSADPSGRLKELNRLLQEAVNQEAYEDAARIRDQIRALEVQMQES
jgi:hypothetical protein